MVAPPQILEYFIVMYQIIHSFESDTSWVLNVLSNLLLWKWLICENDYLMFRKNMEYKGNHSDI